MTLQLILDTGEKLTAEDLGEHLGKGRKGETPIGGTTPGGYKRVGKDKYVPVSGKKRPKREPVQKEKVALPKDPADYTETQQTQVAKDLATKFSVKQLHKKIDVVDSQLWKLQEQNARAGRPRHQPGPENEKAFYNLGMMRNLYGDAAVEVEFRPKKPAGKQARTIEGRKAPKTEKPAKAAGPQKIEAGDRDAVPDPAAFRKMPVGTVVKIPGGATFTKETKSGEGWVETFGGKDDKRYTGSWDIRSDLHDHGGTITKKSDPGETDMEKGELTQAKAKQILRDGEVHGQALTDQQKKFFGAIAGGETPQQKSQDPQSPEEEERMAAKKEEKKDPKPPPIPGVKKSGIDGLATWSQIANQEFGVDGDDDKVLKATGGISILDADTIILEKADDGKPGESLGETSTEELTQTHKDIVARLKGEPKDAAALQKRRETIAAELKKRAGKTDLKAEKGCATPGMKIRSKGKGRGEARGGGKGPMGYTMQRSSVDDLADFAKAGGPFIGPRGGKWADAQHTIPWDEGGAKKPAGEVPKELRGTITVNGKRHEVEAVWEAKPDGMGGHKREYRIRTARGKTKGMTERIDAEGKSSFAVQYKKNKYSTSEVRQASGKTKKDPGVQFEKVQTAMAKIASKGTGNWADADYKKMVELGEKRVKLQKEMGEEPPPGLIANIAKWKERDPGMRAKKSEDAAEITALQEELKKSMYGIGGGRGRGILEWADQFYNTPWHIQALQGIKDRMECDRKSDKMWKDEVPYDERRKWSGAKRGTYEAKQEEARKKIRKERDAIDLRMDTLESNLINYRLDEEKARKSGVDELDDFSKSEQTNEQEEDDMSEENLAKAGEEAVEVEEEQTDQSGLDELAGFAKAQSMPEGNPKQKLGQGEEQGGKLAGVGETSGSNTSGGGPGQDAQGQVKVKKPGKDKLSDDDADDEGQMKPHKKPIESARKSMAIPGVQRAMTAQEQAQIVSKLQKGEEDVEAGGGTPTPPDPAPGLEKGREGRQGMVHYSEASDLAVERLQKSGDFYSGGSPAVVPFSRPIGVGKECPKCGTKLSKSLSACPECGLGTTVHRVLPGGEAQGDHDGEPIVKSQAGKLQPRIEKDVVIK